ncbi:MAG: ABC transporter ATP-binding protein, partial [Dehalococcoidia bacterium]
FIFQSFGLLPLLSAQENVELPLRIAGRGHGERQRRAGRVLDMVGLGRRAEHRPYELSGGEQQRVAIARAMATEPSLLLADEPTGELDSATATAIFTLLRDVARSEGVTIITCTHDPLVMDLADRVEELADGQVVTGEGHVLAHVRQRESSVFRAAHAGSERGPLSSLIGGDTSRLGIASPEGEEQDEPERQGADPELSEPEEDETRWARPDR